MTGHGRDDIGFLIFPNISACRAEAGLKDNASLDDVLGHPSVRSAIAQGLSVLKRRSGGGSSGCATRALLLREPALADAGEITDKGYINQRAVLSRRADAVAVLQDDISTEWIGYAAEEPVQLAEKATTT